MMRVALILRKNPRPTTKSTRKSGKRSADTEPKKR